MARIEEILNLKFRNNFILTSISEDKNSSLLEFEIKENYLAREIINNSDVVIIRFYNVNKFTHFSFENEDPYDFPKMILCIDEFDNKQKVVVETVDVEYIIECERYEVFEDK